MVRIAALDVCACLTRGEMQIFAHSGIHGKRGTSLSEDGGTAFRPGRSPVVGRAEGREYG
jgi:hypothetical protein